MTKILLTGANGQLGREFQYLSAFFPDFDFFFTDRNTLDITKEQEVLACFQENTFNYCINCAAYTAVDKAESEVDQAMAINVEGVSYLAQSCQQQQIPLLHFSTDYVYHNNQNRPFQETDSTQPQSVYAKTKLAGEQAAQRLNPLTMIIRTSWVYSSFGHNFVKTMLRLGQERDRLTVVFDQIGTPTYARDLAFGILTILKGVETGTYQKEQLRGIFHYSNEGVCSWYDFALTIFRITGFNCLVEPIESKDFPTAAQRPPFSVLNKSKIKSTFQLTIPHWQESLEKAINVIRAR